MKSGWSSYIGLLLAAAALAAAPAAHADTYQTYNLAWYNAESGVGATGTMTLDLTTLPNPTTGSNTGGPVRVDIYNSIESLTVTVTDPYDGGGTWTKADLTQLYDGDGLGDYTVWRTDGYTIDMEGDVLAQLEADDGDFNLFFGSNGPVGTNTLTLTTDYDNGYVIQMTEFSPATAATPEPSSLLLLAGGMAGALGMLRRKRSA